MNRRTLSVALVGGIAVAFAAGVWAQSASQQAGHLNAPSFQIGQPAGPIISGADIGFQPVASQPTKDGQIVGKIVVRVNGRWLEVQSPVSVIGAAR